MIVSQTLIDACACAAHEAIRAYCLAIGDTSQPSWADAPEWQQVSARNGVGGVLAGATSRQSHENWMREKAGAGWCYGPVKDPVNRTHPCMVAYDDLPSPQRAKDALFGAVVRAMAAALEEAQT